MNIQGTLGEYAYHTGSLHNNLIVKETSKFLVFQNENMSLRGHLLLVGAATNERGFPR